MPVERVARVRRCDLSQPGPLSALLLRPDGVREEVNAAAGCARMCCAKRCRRRSAAPGDRARAPGEAKVYDDEDNGEGEPGRACPE